MIVLSSDNMRIAKELDMVVFRNRLKEFAVKIGMSLVNQTKLITAASELSRNMLRYAGGGAVLIEIVNGQRQNGVRVTFSDTGPGIPDIDKAMKDGFSTGKSLGLGLPGARRLVNDFDIKSTVGKGTTITITKWKNG
ncbi:anti-sigma regulatory factor [Chitinophaga filiformis]|uniref:Serine/threonine-protein kinase RsbT n=1 Tax=Chitinophaga filiformis TaxID=104663 RepID=A0A1G7Z7T9_CHIFI|nr:anti-sigma regulatory factor [Chitinophaga filiformis]SDH04677.1 serine/threonine-protein kinase RsbT [Chitinophaga filiformis]